MSHARRHHNTTGVRQIRRGKTRNQVKAMAKRLGVPYGANDSQPVDAVAGTVSKHEPSTCAKSSSSSSSLIEARALREHKEQKEEATRVVGRQPSMRWSGSTASKDRS